jgi:hypothetical protein
MGALKTLGCNSDANPNCSRNSAASLRQWFPRWLVSRKSFNEVSRTAAFSRAWMFSSWQTLIARTNVQAAPLGLLAPA